MVEALRCPHCGTPLDADVPHGLCPSCLLEAGLSDSGAWVQDPVDTTPYGVGFVPPPVAELAPHFPQLEILDLLGAGGMGAVYRARQVRLDRLVALKILPLEAGRDSAFAERFTREARALARLGHPHIVGVHDFGEQDGIFYFIMEFVDGASLRQLLAQGALSASTTLRIIPQICDALQYAHEEGIVHRDIKPENILLDKKGRVKIADFGLAKLLGPTPAHVRLTATRQVMGTPHYMAPEQMERPLEVDHRADIYSLGVVFYEMLTGELPLGRFALPSQKTGGDERLDGLVLRALEKEPGNRYQRVSELSGAVSALTGGAFEPGMASDPLGAATKPTEIPAVSVPFTTKAYGGWGEAKGFVRADANGLLVEYVKIFFSIHTTRVLEERLAFADIEAVELKKGWYSQTLIVKARRLPAILDFPGFGDEGVVKLGLAKNGKQAAEQMVIWLQQELLNRRSSPVVNRAIPGAPAPWAGHQAEAKGPAFRAGSFFRSVLNYCVDSLPGRQPISEVQGEPPPRQAAPAALRTKPRSLRRRVIWTLLCLAFYALWFPAYRGIPRDLRPFVGYIDSTLWPYTGQSKCSVSLLPRSKAYPRLILDEEREFTATGLEKASNFSPTEIKASVLTAQFDNPTGTTLKLTIDGQRSLAWKYQTLRGILAEKRSNASTMMSKSTIMSIGPSGRIAEDTRLEVKSDFPVDQGNRI